MKRIAVFIFIFASAVLGRAGFGQVPPPPIPVNAKPSISILQNVGIDQKLGAMVPADLVFKDEAGRDVRLGEYFGKRPMVLVLVYFQCPMLCTMVLNDVLRTIRAMPENLGSDFDIVTVSFDPADTPQLATLKKKTYLAQYNRPGREAGWHFLVGSQQSITALTGAVGFRYVWDPKYNVFAHASGIMVLTPQGKLRDISTGLIMRRRICDWRCLMRPAERPAALPTRYSCTASTTTRRQANTDSRSTER